MKNQILAYFKLRKGIAIGAIITFLLFGVCEYTPLVGLFMIACSLPGYLDELRMIGEDLRARKTEGVNHAHSDMGRVREDITG